MSLIISILILLLIILSAGIYLKKSFSDPIAKTIKYDNNLTIYPGGGCNSIVLTSDDGNKALIVDTKYYKGAEKLRKEVTAADITIINTHFHMDHARGNKLYPNAYIISGVCPWKYWDFDTGHSKKPDKIMNPGEEYIFEIGNEKIHVINIGNAHTATECVVYLEKRKILISGDIIWVKIHPMVLDSNCNISNWLKTLNKLESEFEINTIVPGHGEISNKSALIDMKQYFNSITKAVNNPVELKLLKNKYKSFKTIPIVCNFNKTVSKIKKEKMKIKK